MDFFTGRARDLICICAAYAAGCVSPGYLLVRFRAGKDIRTLWSRSTGGSNVGRVLGRPAFVATVIADGFKGGIAVWAAGHFGVSQWGIVGVMIAVVAGHIWPATLGFRGGKGLATSGGALAVYDIRLALIACGISAALKLAGMGTGSLLFAMVLCPVPAALMGRPGPEIAGLIVIALLVLFAHRDNIRRFFAARRSRKGLRA